MPPSLLYAEEAAAERLAEGLGRFAVATGQFYIASGRFSDARGQFYIVGGRFSDARGQFNVRPGQLDIDSGQLYVRSGQYSEGSGRFSEGSGQLSVGSGQVSEGSGQVSVGPERPYLLGEGLFSHKYQINPEKSSLRFCKKLHLLMTEKKIGLLDECLTNIERVPNR